MDLKHFNVLYPFIIRIAEIIAPCTDKSIEMNDPNSIMVLDNNKEPEYSFWCDVTLNGADSCASSTVLFNYYDFPDQQSYTGKEVQVQLSDFCASMYFEWLLDKNHPAIYSYAVMEELQKEFNSINTDRSIEICISAICAHKKG